MNGSWAMPTQPFQCDKSYCLTTVFRSMIECGFESFSIMACPSSIAKLLIIRSKRGTQPLVSIEPNAIFRHYSHVVFVTLKGLAMPTLLLLIDEWFVGWSGIWYRFWGWRWRWLGLEEMNEVSIFHQILKKSIKFDQN